MTVFSHGREHRNREIIDTIVFTILFLLLPIWSLGRIPTDLTLETFQIDFSQSLNTAVLIPAVILFIVLSVFFIWRRTPYLRKTTKRNTILLLFVAFFLSRVVSIFGFPYGDASFTFTSELYHATATVSYEFTLASRFSSLAQDFCFGFFFVILFGYSDTLGKKLSYLTFIALGCLIVIPFLCFAYSLIYQKDILINNWNALLGAEGYFPKPLESFTGNKNTYGFLLTLGCLACFIFFAKKPNPILPVIVLFFFVNTLICGSRTASSLCFAGTVCFSVGYPLLTFRKHRLTAVCFLIALAAFACFLAYIFTAQKDNPFRIWLDSFIHDMLNFTTITMRMEHWDTAMTMMLDPWYQLFGFGRLPFYNLYRDYQVIIGAESWVITSHNGFLETFMHYGLVGLVLSGVLLLYLLYIIVRLFVKKQFGLSFTYLLVFVLLGIHSYLEPRFVFLDEASNILLILVFVLPCLRDYRDKVLVPSHSC